MANGKFNGGTGGSTTPYLISDAADLDAVRSNVSACYQLVNDIDLASIANWVPIPAFMGSLDGNYHVIRNLTVNRPTVDNVGLFANIVGQVGSAVVNLGLVDCNVVGGHQVGGIVGSIDTNGLVFTNCSVEGVVSGTGNVGGFAGYHLERSNCVFTGVITDCVVSVVDDYAGGFIGRFTSPFADTTSSSAVNVFVYGTISGGNFITARAVTGVATNVTFTNCLYVGDAVGHYVDPQASQVTAASLKSPDVMLDLRFTMTPAYERLYKFSVNDLPRFAFTRKHRFVFAYGGSSYVYSAGAWSPVTITTFPQADLLGMTGSAVRTIPVSAMRALVPNGPVVLNAYSNAPRLSTLGASAYVYSDQLATTVPLTVRSLIPNAALADDREPPAANLTVNSDSANAGKPFNCVVSVEREAAVTSSSTRSAVTVDSLKSAGSLVKNLRVTGKADASVSPRPPYRGYINNHRALTSYASTQRTYSGVNLVTAVEDEAPTTATASAVAAVDANNERTSMTGNMIYEVYNTITTQQRSAHVDAKGDATSRYMLSITNGRTWLTYDNNAGAWVDSKLVDIYTSGVTADVMTSRRIMNALPTDYKSALKLAVGVSVNAFDVTHAVAGFKVEFEPNQGPQVTPIATLDDARNRVNVSGTLFDRENDDISYRILVQQQSATTWTQLLPDVDGTWFSRSNGYTFNHAFTLSSFRAGSNVIKVQTKDSRGAVYENTSTVVITSGAPSITINSQNSFYLDATLDHSSSRNVRFKVLVNGEQLAPKTGWSEWKAVPYQFNFTWDSDDVLHGLPNDVELVVEDELQTEVFSKFNVIGEYKSLLFKDINGFYYSTDKGEILQELDFGTVVGGTLTAPQLVYLENKTGLPMENVSIYVDLTTDEPHTRVKLSLAATPFDDVDELTVPGTLADDGVFQFYVRIDADQDTISFRDKLFKIRAKGDPIVKS